MVASPHLKRLTFPLAAGAAAVLGCVFAVLVALIPGETLESMVIDSGIAAVLSAAEPPLGITARLALMLTVGAGVALFAWFGFYLIVGSRSLSFAKQSEVMGKEDGVPVLRRADAHPDAPPRRPLFAARDLGTPFLDVKAAPIERLIPKDLDQPISAFDPHALRLDPLPMPEPVAALKRVIAEPVPLTPAPDLVPMAPLRRPATYEAFERLETFDLPVQAVPPLATPAYAPIAPVLSQPEPVAQHREAASIHALLDRLERGAVNRAPTPRAAVLPVAPEPPRASNDSLQNALGALRQLATR